MDAQELKRLATSPIVDKFFKQRLGSHESIVFSQDQWEASKGASFISKANAIQPVGRAGPGTMTLTRLNVEGFSKQLWKPMRNNPAEGAVALTFISQGLHTFVIAGIGKDLKLSSLFAAARQGTIPSGMRLMARLAPKLFTESGNVLTAIPHPVAKPKIQAEFVGDPNHVAPKSHVAILGEQSRMDSVKKIMPKEGDYAVITSKGIEKRLSRSAYLNLTRDARVIAHGYESDVTNILPLKIDMYYPQKWVSVAPMDDTKGVFALVRNGSLGLNVALAQPIGNKIKIVSLLTRHRQEEKIQDLVQDNPELFGMKRAKAKDPVEVLLAPDSPLFQNFDNEKAVEALDSIKDLSLAKKKKLLLAVIDGLHSSKVREPITRLADLVLNDIMVDAWEALTAKQIEKHVNSDLIHRQQDNMMMPAAIKDLNDLDGQSGYERGYIFYLILYQAYSEASDYSKYVPKPMKTKKVLNMAKKLGMLTASDVKELS